MGSGLLFIYLPFLSPFQPLQYLQENTDSRENVCRETWKYRELQKNDDLFYCGKVQLLWERVLS